ncbi:MFS transporter [Rhodococcus sp. MEB041]|uniref:MFS transporter n=1 Tax=Rhodococcus sp. MEB041 TaxID=3040323 RepID=UPI00254AAE26|nr:MFS transporter [Rhodococcus sp. MEB041]
MPKMQPRLAAGASLIGTTIEYYDFFVYATAAALVFNKVFFPGLGEFGGTLASLSTFAVAFFFRPLGGIVIGHFGDKVGRRPMLILTLTMMGVATVLIGVLPTFATIGVAAPILLVLLRAVQGFALGGEYGGAVVLTMEHSPVERRGFFGSFTTAGGPLALVLATLVFLPITALPEEALLSWGWRIPFILSAVLIFLGFYLRRTIEESPAFAEVKSAGRQDRSPALTIVRQYPLRSLLIAGISLSAGVSFYVLAVFGLSYGTGTVGFSRQTMLEIVMVTMIFCFAFMVAAGRLSDRIGRPKCIVAGMAGLALWAFPWLWLVGSGNAWLALVGCVVLCIPLAMNMGVMGVFLAECFPPEVRYAGISIGYTIGLIVGSGLAPLIATTLTSEFGAYAVGWYLVAMSLVSLLSVAVLLRTNGHTAAGRRTPVSTSSAPRDKSDVIH